MFIVHTEASLGWGGQEIRILTEAAGMIARGHRVEVWAAADSNILREAARRGLPHRAVPLGRRARAGVVAMRHALKDARPDVINTHSSTDSWLAALACLGLANAPAVVRTRHISVPVAKDPATRWLYTRATRHIVTTGESLRAALVRDNGFRPGRVTSVPTGIDTERFAPGDKAQARATLKLEPHARYIGIVATLRSWKGHLFLLDAFATLAAARPDLRLLIVGDGPMAAPIGERIAALGIAAKVTLAGQQDAVETWLRALDVFCLPSYANEGVPQAVVQAMLTGCAIVTTPVGAITEAITHAQNGLIVPPRDADALAAAIARLLDEPALAARLGTAARADACARFGFATMVARMEQIFRAAAEGQRRRRRGLKAHFARMRQSLGRRWREWRLPRGYRRLGTTYGGWWIDRAALSREPLLIDCGLGMDISFPTEFLREFGGRAIGVEPSPESLAYCRPRLPAGMTVLERAFAREAGQHLTFYLPRAREHLPAGADGISGSLVDSHAYVGGGEKLPVTTTALGEVLAGAARDECDVLKLDIEGAEYEVLNDLCARGEIRRVRQLLVEFHHRATHHTDAETDATVAAVERAGFRLMHVEGRNYIFRRADLG